MMGTLVVKVLKALSLSVFIVSFEQISLSLLWNLNMLLFDGKITAGLLICFSWSLIVENIEASIKKFAENCNLV